LGKFIKKVFKVSSRVEKVLVHTYFLGGWIYLWRLDAKSLF